MLRWFIFFYSFRIIPAAYLYINQDIELKKETILEHKLG